jgi:glycosyltransferase involved in cell wall biosynthesis
MARVTVVTAAYNAEPFLEQAILSVLAQTYADYEYVIVDDGSSDATPDIIDRYAGRLRCIRQANAGEGLARNRGFEVAEGEFVAVIDADDLWAADKLERQVAAMETRPDAGLCYTNALSIRADGFVISPRMVPEHPPLTCLMALTGRNPIVTSSVLFRRTYLESRPYLNLHVAEDHHVNLKVLWRSGERSVFIDKPLVSYRIVDTSILRQVDAWERGRDTLRAVEAFIDDMRAEKAFPQDQARRAIAYAYFQWAWYCIDAGIAPGFASRQLVHAVLADWRLSPQAGRQFAKIVLRRVGVK